MTSRTRIPIAFWIAVLSLTGTIVTALLNPALVQIFVPDETATPTVVPIIQTSAVVPTATIAPALIILTPEPTAALQPTSTPIALPTQSPALIGDCLRSDQWEALPAAPEGGECLDLVHWGITPYNDALTLYQQGFRELGIFGVSHSLPRNAVITLTLNLRQLESAELWLGVTAESDPRVASWMFVIQKDQFLDVRTLKDGRTTTHANNITIPFNENKYRVKIEFVGSQIDLYVNDNHLTPSGSIPFSKRKLFIGYQSISANISAYISAQIQDVDIKELK
jgi:hypothetical protein